MTAEADKAPGAPFALWVGLSFGTFGAVMALALTDAIDTVTTLILMIVPAALFFQAMRAAGRSGLALSLCTPRELPRASLEQALHGARQAVLRYDEPALEQFLRQLVPEYSSGTSRDAAVSPIHRAS